MRHTEEEKLKLQCFLTTSRHGCFLYLHKNEPELEVNGMFQALLPNDEA